MSDHLILPDDPRLTAYALDELDPTEREAFEAQLARSPAAQTVLREIRDVAGLLATQLKDEPAPALTAAQRTRILHATVPTIGRHDQATGRLPTRWVSRFAALVTMVSLIALATLLPVPLRQAHDPVRPTVQSNADHPSHPAWELASNKREPMAESNRFPEAEGLSQTMDKNGVAGGVSAGAAGFGFNNQPLDELAETARPADGKPDNRSFSLNGRQLSDGLSAVPPAGASMSDGSVRYPSELARQNEAGGRAKYMRDVNGRGESKPGMPTDAKRSALGIVPSFHRSTAARQSAQTGPQSPATESAPGLPELVNGVSAKPALSQGREAGGPDSLYRHAARGMGSGGAQPLSSAGGALGSAWDLATDGASRGLSYARPAPTREPQVRHWEAELKSDGEKQRDHYSIDAGAPGTEVYEPIVENPFLSSYESPLSTFGVDVDTASYSNVRRFLTDGQRPPASAVRIEELVNYFAYDYPQPAAEHPFSVNVEAANCPWNPAHRLVRIGLKGREIARDQRPNSNLVFLVDVSGSMQAENKLPLVKMGLNLLTQQMTESDKVAIVTYSDTAALRLPATNGTNKPAILAVIEALHAGGSTNGAGGIQLAYRTALEHFIAGGSNRVILCTDGDFNVGVTGDDELVQLIQERARTRIFFSVLGFGMGNLKDGKLEKLADKGNGQYAYIDNQREARKVFVDDLAGTLVTIAKNVKIQVEFNPNQVGAHRLIGYENRVMAAQDFNNDAKDAGDMGAGHTVTALYEIAPAAEVPKPELGDALRYRKTVAPHDGPLAHELLTVKLRYKLPEADTSTLVEVPVPDPDGAADTLRVKAVRAQSRPSPDFNWAAAVAAFGMILRDSHFRGQASFDMVLELAQGAKGEDKAGRREEFIDLVKKAKTLFGESATLGGKLQPASPDSGDSFVALPAAEAEAKAGVNGKYKNLLRIVPAEDDKSSYNAFYDYGRWDGTSYAGQTNLPQGFWVYVYPNWYIWGDAVIASEKR